MEPEGMIPSATTIRSRSAHGITVPAGLVDRLRGMESAASLALLSAGLLALVGLAAGPEVSTKTSGL
jgi:hypothetical protein